MICIISNYYEHGIDRDDAKFDAAYDFINDYTKNTRCDVNQCRCVQRNYRERGNLFLDLKALSIDALEDEVSMDIMAMIHCYFVHSFDINRMTKEERDRVDAESSYGMALYDEEKGDSESGDMLRTKFEFPDCNGQNVRRMYNVIRKWKYIKMKKDAVDDGKDDEKEPVVEDDIALIESNQRPAMK